MRKGFFILNIILMFIINSNSLAINAVLENDKIKIEFNEKNGSIEKLISKINGWEIERRSDLALSFLMNVPKPNQRFNPVIGNSQNNVEIEIDDEAKQILLTWKNLQSQQGDRLDIIFKGIVKLNDNCLTFIAELENNTPYTIETVRWPQLGDLSIPDGTDRFSQIGIDYGGMKELELYPKFDNQPGYFAVDNPQQALNSPDTPFSIIGNGKEGIYIGYHDTSVEDLVQFKAELKPGYLSYELWDTGVNPKGDTIAGQKVHIEFSTVHFLFVNPNTSAKLKPIVLQPFTGTWHKGADIYKEWRSTWFEAPYSPVWFNKVHSWQQIHMNNPEDDIRYSYTDLLEIGKDCAANGVKALQVTGWTMGGQDKDNPSHDIDPRLGTWEDFSNTIKEIQNLGVKVILFTKFTWADRATEWYNNELIKYTTKDPFGDPHYYNGYAYQTDVQLAEINTRHFSPMCHLSAEWRTIASNEFSKTLELNADGMLFDENQHHGGARYCYDKSHGHKLPAHIYSGDQILAKGFEDIRDDSKPDYIFAGEGNYDLEFSHYNLSYFRVDLNHVPIHRYVAPDEEMMIAISGYNDRNLINTALLYRYIISYEPRNFKGRLTEFPMTLEYGEKVDSLRRKYDDLLWNGEFKHTVGATVLVEGEPYEKYSVYENKANKKRGIVVANFNYDRSLEVDIDFEGNYSPLFIASPEHFAAIESNGKETIIPNSAIFVFEK